MNFMKKEAGLDVTESATNKKTTICPDCVSYQVKDGKKLCIEVENRIAYGIYTLLDNALKVYAHWYCGGVGDRKEIIEHVKEMKHWGDALEKALLVYEQNKCLEAKDPCYHCDHFKKQESTPEQDAANARELTNELLKNAAK